MHPKLENIHAQHVSHVMSRMIRDLYGETLSLTALCAVTQDPVPYGRRLALDYRPIAEGEIWGGPWDSAWFHLNATVPDCWEGREIALLFQATGEALLFDPEGVPQFAFTGGSVFSPGYSKDRFILGRASGGQPLDLWVEAAANLLGGLVMDHEPSLQEKHPRGSLTPVVHQMRLAIFNRQVWQLLLDMRLLHDIMGALPEEDFRRRQILTALDRAACAYKADPRNAEDARACLKDLLARPAMASALTAHAVGHAHIDVGWLWPVRESIRKAARTYASQLQLMETYPEYIFGASQPQLYQFVRDAYPKLFDKIRQKVAEGRWEPQGGMWVEADCNLISGESMVRQFLHGKNFFMDEFGVDVNNLWLPDVFGYSAALPQIIKKAGCDYFLTQKLSWSQVNEFPHDTFWWQGLDGTKVLTHFPPEKTYNSFLTPDAMIRTQNCFKENAFLKHFITLFGIGDGGGGPCDDMLERLNRQKDLEYTPRLQCDTARHFFQELAQAGNSLETWTGELYLEFHRGTFTTQARMKRWNRENEQTLAATEQLLAQLPMADYPAEEMDRCWKKLLLNQFHDILPGSSIREVYKVAEREEQEISQTCRRLQQNAADRLFTQDPDSMTLLNTLSCAYSGTIPLPDDWAEHQVLDSQDRELPVQMEKTGPVIAVTVPGNAFMTLRRGKKTEPGKRPQEQELVLENDLARYEFDPTGKLISAFLKQEQREMMAAPGNVLTLYYDHPNTYEAWDIDIYYPQEMLQVLEATAAGKDDCGPVRDTLDFTYAFGNSTVTQKVSLQHNSPRLDFRTEVDWHEARKLLRVAFPVDVQTHEAQYDIQYGYVRRPTHDNTSWDQARFEAVGHRYADLSDQQAGVALLNDCKYGYKIKGNTLDLALLRSPKHPDFQADQGRHQFTYALLPHAGDALNSQVIDEAARLNRPPLAFPGCHQADATPFCRLDAEDISLEVLKKAEREDCRIIRLVETKGRTSAGTLVFRDQPRQVVETNLMEWEDLQSMTVTAKRLRLTLKPFEILTLKAR